MSLGAFLSAHGPEMLSLSLEHAGLVCISISLACAIGVPVGIVIFRRPALARPVLGIANVAQTIPSLALFGFLIPVHLNIYNFRVVGGIGPATAVTALVLYALLPIIRNTYTGLEGVDPAVRDAGKAMGMTPWQLLRRVELPLALPLIIAGIRVATVITIGTATIAAAIDAGGLGKFIFRGLRMNDNALILAGAVPAALMAITADALLGGIQALFSRPRRFKAPRWGLPALATAALLAAWGWHARPLDQGNSIVVGAKDFTEQLILGELLASTLESQTNLKVIRRFDLGGNLAYEAIKTGDIDLYAEYTGTALSEFLHHAPLHDATEVLGVVREESKARDNLIWLQPLGFSNTFAILVRGSDALGLHLKTISDVSRYSDGWRPGFGQDFMSRPDGYQGFVKAYWLRFKQAPEEMELSLTYGALKSREVDLIAGNSTDGLIARYGLMQLQDDKHYFPPYDAVPVVRRQTLESHPEIRQALGRLAGLLSVADMRRLNGEVDQKHADPRAVAREFLHKKGLWPR